MRKNRLKRERGLEMDFLKKNYMGIFVCFAIAVPS
jgi:hypothetical protein